MVHIPLFTVKSIHPRCCRISAINRCGGNVSLREIQMQVFGFLPTIWQKLCCPSKRSQTQFLALDRGMTSHIEDIIQTRSIPTQIFMVNQIFESLCFQETGNGDSSPWLKNSFASPANCQKPRLDDQETRFRGLREQLQAFICHAICHVFVSGSLKAWWKNPSIYLS